VVLPAATCLYCASRVPCLGCSWGVCDAWYHVATSLCGREERGWYAALATCAHLMAIQPVCRAGDTVTAARVCGTSTTRRLQGPAHGTAAVPGGNGRASCVWVMPALLALDRSLTGACFDRRTRMQIEGNAGLAAQNLVVRCGGMLHRCYSPACASYWEHSLDTSRSGSWELLEKSPQRSLSE